MGFTSTSMRAALAQPERSPPCAPTRLVADQEPVAAPWKKALDDLLDATSLADRPWSCAGARIRLYVGVSGAVLEVEDARGRRVERRVPGPEDLVAIGEGLLASPLPEPPPATPPVAAAPDVGPPNLPPDPVAARPPQPRMHIDGSFTGHYMGPATGLWGGASLHATVPLDAWAGGVWARYDGPAWMLTTVPADFSMFEVAVGLTLERRLVGDRLELRAALEPSLVVLAMEGGAGDPTDGGRLDGRVGLALRAFLALSPRWRLVTGVDGELAPAALGGSDGRRIRPSLPPIPAYTLGVSVGVGVGLW